MYIYIYIYVLYIYIYIMAMVYESKTISSHQNSGRGPSLPRNAQGCIPMNGMARAVDAMKSTPLEHRLQRLRWKKHGISIWKMVENGGKKMNNEETLGNSGNHMIHVDKWCEIMEHDELKWKH